MRPTVGIDAADAPARLDALVRAHVGVVTEDVERASVFVHEWRSLASGKRSSISRRRDAYEARFRSVIEQGVATSAFDAVDPIAAAAFILTALNGLVAWYRPSGRLRPADVADAYAALALGAVGGAAIARQDVAAMTDPLALDPILSPRERSRPASNAELPHDERFALFEAHIADGGYVEATDWMPDEYRTAVLRFVEMHANSELMGVLPEREWLMRAPTLRRKLALTAKVQDEVGHAQLLYRIAEDLGKPREAMFDDLLAGQDQVPQRLPLPDRRLGRRGDDRVARGRRRDRRPAGAPRLVVRPVRPDDAQDLLGGIGPHHARARRRRDHGHRHARPARRDPGRARPLVGPADADARPALAARDRPRPALADQGEDQRGAAPGVPDDLRAADPRARAGDPGPGPAPRRGDRHLDLRASRTGRSCGPSSPTTARCPRHGSRSGASPGRRPAGSARRSWRRRAAA